MAFKHFQIDIHAFRTNIDTFANLFLENTDSTEQIHSIIKKIVHDNNAFYTTICILWNVYEACIKYGIFILETFKTECPNIPSDRFANKSQKPSIETHREVILNTIRYLQIGGLIWSKCENVRRNLIDGALKIRLELIRKLNCYQHVNQMIQYYNDLNPNGESDRNITIGAFNEAYEILRALMSEKEKSFYGVSVTNQSGSDRERMDDRKRMDNRKRMDIREEMDEKKKTFASDLRNRLNSGKGVRKVNVKRS